MESTVDGSAYGHQRSFDAVIKMRHDLSTQNPTSHDDVDSLDPRDWQSFRRLSHAALDDAIDRFESITEGPVWQPIPDSIKEAIDEPLPVDGTDLESIRKAFQANVLPYTNGNQHPGFSGWVHGAGTPTGMLAEMLAASINCNLGGREHAPVYIEKAVIRWARELFGFPQTASGLLLSGTSMATLVGLTVARHWATRGEVRCKGLQDSSQPPLKAYTSSEAHGSIRRACEMIGIGSAALRSVETDRERRLDVTKLAEAVERDRQTGCQPFAVIATAGTVNTGAIDPLDELADFCQRHSLWLHVDGAFGASLMLHPRHAIKLDGIQRADSLAFDYHKWMQVPYDAGCLLVRDGQLHQEAFASRADYLCNTEKGLASADHWFCDFGPELSRGFRALKVWFTQKEFGTKRLGETIDHSLRLASWLAEAVAADPRLELIAFDQLNIVCFRLKDPQLSPQQHDQWCDRVVATLQEEGIAAPSTTRIDGRNVIRVCLINHRTGQQHLQRMLDGIHQIHERQETATHETAAPQSGIAADDRPSQERASEQISIIGDLNPVQRQLLDSVTQHWAVRSRLNSVCLQFEADLPTPISVEEADTIVLGSSALHSRSSLRFWLDYASTVTDLRQAFGDEITFQNELSIALLACRTAARSIDASRSLHVNAIEASANDGHWLAICLSNGSDSDWSLLGDQPELVIDALHVQGVCIDKDCTELIVRSWQEAFELACRLQHVALPTEAILTMGGDNRIQVDADNHLNQYGVGATPVPEIIDFSSSTASSISTSAYRHVDSIRREMMIELAESNDMSAVRDRLETIRTRLKSQLDLEQNSECEIILSASGTDTELLTLASIPQDDQPIMNVVLSPNESGSGLFRAAQGCHYSSIAASGRPVEIGAAISGLHPNGIELAVIAGRDDEGMLRTADEIERAIDKSVAQAEQSQRRAIVHVLDCSKTGWHAPRIEFIRNCLKRYGNRIRFVVDACQMRITSDELHRYLAAGAMVQMTGSKFFGGPAFCGALIMPEKIADELRSVPALADGLRDYTTNSEWPSSIQLAQSSLDDRINFGLILRWEAALHEMGRFRGVSESIRLSNANEFASRVAERLQRSRWLTQIDDDGPNDKPQASIHGRFPPTIFPFSVLLQTSKSETAMADVAQLKQLQRWLTNDLSRHAAERNIDCDPQRLSRRFRLGQPVLLGRRGRCELAVLRLCASAATIAGFDSESDSRPPQPGQSDSIDSAIASAFAAIEKAEVIASHWHCFTESNATPPRSLIRPPSFGRRKS